MFGFRYHVATICAMFLMLGIGFWLGSVSGFGPTFANRQTATIAKLSSRLDNVVSDAERDHTLLRQHEEALSALVPRLVAGRLTGRRIAIVRAGDYTAAAQQAADAITAAGGVVASTTTITDRITLLDDEQRAKVLSDLKMLAAPGADVLVSVLHPLTAALRYGTDARADLDTALGILGENGIIETSGDYTLPVTEVVVVGGSISDTAASNGAGADVEPIETALLSNLLSGAPTLTVVGCEPSDAAISSTPDYGQVGIASVDCIDLPLGALDLPYALRSGEAAAYGVKPSATRLLPAALTSDGTDAAPEEPH